MRLEAKSIESVAGREVAVGTLSVAGRADDKVAVGNQAAGTAPVAERNSGIGAGMVADRVGEIGAGEAAGMAVDKAGEIGAGKTADRAAVDKVAERSSEIGAELVAGRVADGEVGIVGQIGRAAEIDGPAAVSGCAHPVVRSLLKLGSRRWSRERGFHR